MRTAETWLLCPIRNPYLRTLRPNGRNKRLVPLFSLDPWSFPRKSYALVRPTLLQLQTLACRSLPSHACNLFGLSFQCISNLSTAVNISQPRPEIQEDLAVLSAGLSRIYPPTAKRKQIESLKGPLKKWITHISVYISTRHFCCYRSPMLPIRSLPLNLHTCLLN